MVSSAFESIEAPRSGLSLPAHLPPFQCALASPPPQFKPTAQRPPTFEMYWLCCWTILKLTCLGFCRQLWRIKDPRAHKGRAQINQGFRNPIRRSWACIAPFYPPAELAASPTQRPRPRAPARPASSASPETPRQKDAVSCEVKGATTGERSLLRTNRVDAESCTAGLLL